MKQIRLEQRGFPGGADGIIKLPFSMDALARGVIAAGNNPNKKPGTFAAQSDINMRTAALLSAVKVTRNRLKPTPEFLEAGVTEKGYKSFFVGNALCAHAALQQLGIPWLVDFEKLATKHKGITVTPSGNGKRPDYLGNDLQGNWHVFESKGRSRNLFPGEIKDWMEQAESILEVNGKQVVYQIVSAAHLTKKNQWELLWVDPEPEEDDPTLEFDEPFFFRSYYAEILSLLAKSHYRQVTNEGLLVPVPDAGIWVGLHREVLEALLKPIWQENQEWPARGLSIGQSLGGFGEITAEDWLLWNPDAIAPIHAFAKRRISAGNDETPEGENTKVEGVAIFPDGILIKSNPRRRSRRQQYVIPSPQPPSQPATIMKSKKPTSPGEVGHSERETQNRIIALFRNELNYRYLGNRIDRTGNSNIDEDLLAAHLVQSGYTLDQIGRAIHLLRVEAENPNRSLYDNNKAIYSYLRYGVPVKIEAGKVTETVNLIDWEIPENNDFVIVEEVTLHGGHERRPDLVLYVNGIAVAVLELKKSSVSISEGIRQLLSNQSKDFNEWFFTTVQIVFAGSDSEGLKYGTIKTEEKMFLRWKEEEDDNAGYKLDKYLLKMCRKDRLIELMHDFILFDGGIKKLPRVHQYFGIKASQKRLLEYLGGIIWHTQGSGKSIVMVLLAKWILENLPNARVLILTDRDELDKQIKRVFDDSGEEIHRTSSGRDLMEQLGQAKPRLLCSLIHKFGRKGVDDFDAFIEELKQQASPAVGQLFVFVDECHRTQNGKLHKTMKALLPGAVFIGFTGTPLLKADRQTTMEVFGSYIHTYKFREAVIDDVVLDLVYEARDIEQQLGSQDKIDQWFESKTKGLNEWQKAALREQWGTMQKVLSSRSRMERVVEDILFDFGVKPRLISQRGNAMLVASSIYEAARYYELFQKTPFKGRCAVVTSYNPQAQDVTKEETGANSETDKQFLFNLYTDLLRAVKAKPGKSKTETYEDEAKRLFIKQPANMRLLIVVDKLLTGFDAPSCTYLYIDKSMQDHGLFQAICRTNRLDGDDKPFGYIVDYKDLFKKLVNDKGTGALQVYSAELDDSAGGASPDVLMQDRLQKGRERLDQALETVELLCAPVAPPAVQPNRELAFIHYFCGNVEIPEELKAREHQRFALYKAVASLLRAYANIADDLPHAGYSEPQIAKIKADVTRAVDLRELIRLASGEAIDLKAYEADMRHLIDTYIEARDPKKISAFDDMGLLEVIERSGLAEAIAQMPGAMRKSKDAVAETIANNVRSKIIKEHLNDPAFYDKMSALLKEILDDLKAKRISYEKFLKKIADEVIKPVQKGAGADTPTELDTPAKRALYSNLPEPGETSAVRNVDVDPRLKLALAINETVRNSRPDNWRGNLAKENLIKQALLPVLNYDEDEVERIFPVIIAQREY